MLSAFSAAVISFWMPLPSVKETSRFFWSWLREVLDWTTSGMVPKA